MLDELTESASKTSLYPFSIKFSKSFATSIYLVSKSKTITTFDLDIGDANWKKVLTYVAQNKHLGLPKIVKNLEQKYKIKASVKKELSKHV